MAALIFTVSSAALSSLVIAIAASAMLAVSRSSPEPAQPEPKLRECRAC
jgi:hypothetical protein